MKKYNLINNTLGWLCFVVAAITYLLTIEPTASFWDCPEFISQGQKLEVGHPPGNPIFILTARFFINFAGGSASAASVAVNVMSALLSAATILLLFWTITHLVRKLMVGRKKDELTLPQLITVMGSGLCGALLYTWSDTFWFSAVEGEVYAFSSFCTALVFWLILKWESRADDPHSDRYLIFVAFIIGISIAVHLLNLLTIPALAMVIYYRKASKVNFKGGLVALLASFVVVALILYGLVPGFIEIAGYFELFFVNVCGMSYNMGVLIYAILLVAVLVWCVRSLYVQKSRWQMTVSFILSVVLSGIPFIGHSLWIPAVLTLALVAYFLLARRIYVRLLNIIALSILVIFVGYSSYALLLIRSHANPPMNQNAPDNVFALASYLNREQYGETPLFYGPSFASSPEYEMEFDDEGYPIAYSVRTDGAPKTTYNKVVKTNPSDPDKYVLVEGKADYNLNPKMVFPRMYSQQPGHPEGYLKWINARMEDLPQTEVPVYFNADGSYVKDRYGLPITESVGAPTFGQNLDYFFTYQLGYMYWRYFMWNFAGRQNDYQGQGEVNRGNWISGIPFIDNPRLGDQSLLPDDFGKGNKGHNVFYMLPLLMGLLGIAAQLIRGNEGLRQFWVVFLLFFMTGIAIVLYLNQPPNQPRERDYAFAGSFYAFAIWIGMGVYFLWLIATSFMHRKDDAPMTDDDDATASIERRKALPVAIAAAVIGLAVPLQMVSQTWDDHDRSGRYAARDFGMNYLSSLDENAVIFTNGDNDTFPLWYAQEVEGYRRDVRVVNLAYLTTDWYANHMKMPAYEAAALDFQAKPEDYAYDRLQVSVVNPHDYETPIDVFSSLNDLYTNPLAFDKNRGYRVMLYPKMYIPVDKDLALEKGIISPLQAATADDYILVDFSDKGSVTLSEALSLDIIAHGAADNWKRPAYFAMTVPNEYYLGLEPYMRATGLAYQVTPSLDPEYNGYDITASTDKMYDNVMNRFRWGGIDTAAKEGKSLYLDETVRRMVTTHRSALLDLATQLYYEGYDAIHGYNSPAASADGFDPDAYEPTPEEEAFAAERFTKAVEVLDLMQEKLPTSYSPYAIQIGERVGSLYAELGKYLEDTATVRKGVDVLASELHRYMQYVPYLNSLLQDERRRLVSQGLRGNVSLAQLPISRADAYVPAYIQSLTQSLYGAGLSAEDLEDIFSGYDDHLLSQLESMLPSKD